MDKETPSKTDQILDLLLEALLERQTTRQQTAEPTVTETMPDDTPVVEEPATPEPAANLDREETVEEAANEVGPEPSHALEGEPVPETAWNTEWLKESEPEEPLEPLPSIQLDKMLRRLALAVGVLILLINIPFNRTGLSLARAMPDAQSLIIRDGLVLKGSGERIYVLENNQKRWISSLEAFEWFGYRWEQVNGVDDAFLDRFADGRPLYVLLKCQTSPHIYALEDGQKRWIKDIRTFEAEGFVWEDVKFESCGVLRQIPTGDPIPPDAGPSPEP